MKLSKNAQNILAIGGVILVIGFLIRRQAAVAVEAIADINVGTPFEGAGVIGAVGNVTNVASGGILAQTGSAIGEFFSGLFDTRTLDELTGG
jgi:hypothetical protein